MHPVIAKLHSLQMLLGAWIAFIAFGTGLALLTPLGEGIDEPAHLAYIQRIAQARELPMGHPALVSQEISELLNSEPVSWTLHSRSPYLLSYEDYWQQDPSIRTQRDNVVRKLQFSGKYAEATGDPAANEQYERYQPPLYYLISAPIFALASRSLSFVDTFLAVRLWSVLLASTMVPGALFLATGLFDDRPWIKSVLMMTILFPGLYPGVVRVANDALAVSIATWLLGCLVHFLETERRHLLLAASVLLAAGLWTKAFFIPLLIGTLLTLVIFRYSRQALTVLLIASVGLVWYGYTFILTGSLTGLPETVSAGTAVTSSLQTLGSFDWRNLIDGIRSFHIWAGNASLLTLPESIYRLTSWLFLAGVFGCLLGWRSGTSLRALLALGLNYLLFIGAALYYSARIFQSGSLSAAEGWYLTLLIPVEVVLFVAGVRSYLLKGWPVCIGVCGLLLLALTLYANLFVMLPYYAGMTAHAATDHLQIYVPSGADSGIILQRLLRLHPWLPSFVPALLIAGFSVAGLWVTATLVKDRGTTNLEPEEHYQEHYS